MGFSKARYRPSGDGKNTGVCIKELRCMANTGVTLFKSAPDTRYTTNGPFGCSARLNATVYTRSLPSAFSAFQVPVVKSEPAWTYTASRTGQLMSDRAINMMIENTVDRRGSALPWLLCFWR